MFDKAKAAGRFEARTVETSAGTVYIRKPKVREFTRYLDLVRRCVAAQKAAGEGAEFDPDGLTDAALVRMVACDSDGVLLFAPDEDVEGVLSPAEILDIATAGNEQIHPTVNPTPGPTPRC